MRQKEKQKAFWTAVIAIVFVGMACWVSNVDYNHTVVSEMDDYTYDTALQELSEAGNDAPSDSEIVEWWNEHHR